MKKVIYFLTLMCAVVLTTASCGEMDDNYEQYLENIPTYSPAVRNLKAVSPEAGSLTLSWDLVDGTNRIKAIQIVAKKTATDVKTYDIPEVVTSYTISGLDLQGYEFNVYTIDILGNKSIPVTSTFTPIPGRE